MSKLIKSVILSHAEKNRLDAARAIRIFAKILRAVESRWAQNPRPP
jgi:hypothetical protein